MFDDPRMRQRREAIKGECAARGSTKMHSADHKAQPLVEIRLYGHLRARFGKRYNLAVMSAGEAVRALCTVVPGFRRYLVEHSTPGYRVWLGADPVKDTDELKYPPGQLIRIVPVTAGAKSGGLGQVFLGAALIGISYATGGLGMGVMSAYAQGGMALAASSIAGSLGVAMTLGGVSQMLAGIPKAPAPSERPNNQPSYAFNGAVNVTSQGNPVPILYGRLRVGSQVISTGLSVAQLP